MRVAAKKTTCKQVLAGTAVLAVGVTGGWVARSAIIHENPMLAARTETRGTTSVLHGTLISYDSCAGLLGELHARGRAAVGPYGFGTVGTYMPLLRGPVPELANRPAAGSPSAASDAALPHSTTNTQVASVDEPDQVKTDGRLMVSLDGQQLRVVDVRTARLRATLALPHPGSELLLAGDRVMVLSGPGYGSYGGPMPLAAGPAVGGDVVRPYYPGYRGGQSGSETTATVVDLADPDAPKVLRSWTFDSAELAARVVNGTIRLVVRTEAPKETWSSPRDGSTAERDRATKANQALIDTTSLDDWLPHWRTDANPGQSHRLSGCGDVALPAATPTHATSKTGYSTLDIGLITVVSLDPAASEPGAGTSVLGSGSDVYAEGHHLYVSSPTGGDVRLFEFDLSDPAQARYLASGTVQGSLHDAYALSEYQDRLRVTTTNVNSGAAVTGISVLARQGDRLVQVGRVDGLGAGEQVYAVRYLGDRGYVVTFRQVDPLHVVDLADPTRPVLRGTLSMPGYSSLLLPLPGHRLLGIGQSIQQTNGFAEPDGLQLAVFDVTDAAHPTLLDRQVVSSAGPNAVDDPHAVTVSPSSDFVVVPTSGGLMGADINENRLRLIDGGFVKPYAVSAARTVIADKQLFELTDRGVAVRDTATLRQVGWIAF